MKVIYDAGKVDRRLKNAVVVIGVFDGLHIGHQKLIKSAVRRAKKLGVPCTVMTFFPHPVHVLRPEINLPFIVSLLHRFALIEQLGADACLVVRFTKTFARKSAAVFVEDFLIGNLRPLEVFVGGEFSFGKNREGSIAFFREAGRRHGFKVNTVTSVMKGRKKIGSSQIRRHVAAGRLDGAKELLGRNVAVMGIVKKGDGRGRTLGFPTANIYPDARIVLPAGVFAVRVRVGGKMYKGMANVGRRPTFRGEKRVSVEIHLFDFHGSLYGQTMIVEFIKKIRNERTFASERRLAAQIRRDETRCRAVL